MKVICNSTPIISLASVNKLHLLNDVFGDIIVPQAVYNEVAVAGSNLYGANEVRGCPWITVQKPKNNMLFNYLLKALDRGEAEVIVLADEIDADLIILDERMARKYAQEAGFNLIGTLGVLSLAKLSGHIDEIRSLVIEMLDKNRWFNKELVNEVLKKAGEPIL